MSASDASRYASSKSMGMKRFRVLLVDIAASRIGNQAGYITLGWRHEPRVAIGNIKHNRRSAEGTVGHFLFLKGVVSDRDCGKGFFTLLTFSCDFKALPSIQPCPRRLFKIIADIHERYVEFFEFAFHCACAVHPIEQNEGRDRARAATRSWCSLHSRHRQYCRGGLGCLGWKCSRFPKRRLYTGLHRLRQAWRYEWKTSPRYVWRLLWVPVLQTLPTSSPLRTINSHMVTLSAPARDSWRLSVRFPSRPPLWCRSRRHIREHKAAGWNHWFLSFCCGSL